VALFIEYVAATGGSYGATIRKVTDAGALGDYWSTDEGDWVSDAPTYANSDFPLTEGSSTYIGLYTATVTALGTTYSGRAIVCIHDEGASNLVKEAIECYVASGTPHAYAVPVSVSTVTESRTWKIRTEGDEHAAYNTISLPAGSSVVLSFDFAGVLNPGSSISSVSSVAETTANSLGIAGASLSDDKTSVHFTASSVVADTDYTVKATVVTTDGQTVTATGNIEGT